MPNDFRKPTEADFADPKAIGRFIRGQQKNSGFKYPLRTSASAYGIPQYAATSFSLSDVIQGTYAVNDPTDTMLLVNKALTQDLSFLYDTGAEPVNSFSTVPIAPQSSSDFGSGSPGGGDFDSGSGFVSTPDGAVAVDENWVSQLPLVHPTTGAIIWTRRGKCSREMHLGTSDNIQTDIAQHRQHQDMRPEWKHPWNMDRSGGPIGGEGKIYTNVGDAETILGESANAYGLGGAFGFLKPEEEQYYISMAWPYSGGPIESFQKAGRQDVADQAATLKQSAYRGKRVLVYSTHTKRACVCTPGDWGPQPYWSNAARQHRAINGFYAGLSPDTHWVLGTDHGVGEFLFGWVSDTTPLGLYTPQAGQGMSPGYGGNVSGGGNVDYQYRTTNQVPTTGSGIKARDFVQLATQQNGKSYVFNTGSITDPDPDSFDCSGLVYWCAMKLGYRPPAGTPSDWSYSLTIIDMMTKAGTLLDLDVAYKTSGAILAWPPAGGKAGHVAISLGNGKTIEAASPKNGVTSLGTANRKFTIAGYLPGMVF